jgi:hypothetical protein
MKTTELKPTENVTPAPVGSGVLLGTWEPPFCKDIEYCGNLGCAFNGAFGADKGRCTSTYGQCFGYMELPNDVMSQPEDGAKSP